MEYCGHIGYKILISSEKGDFNLKFKKAFIISLIVASMMVMSQSAFADEAREFDKLYTRCFAGKCDVDYYIKDGDSFNLSIRISMRDGSLEKRGKVGFFTAVEKGSKEYQETIKRLKDLDKYFDSDFGHLSL